MNISVVKSQPIAFFTGNRAEYFLLKPILRVFEASSFWSVTVIVSGAHLDASYGYTADLIHQDGWENVICIDIPSPNSGAETASAIGSAIKRYVSFLETKDFKYLVVYADRFEGLAAVIAGFHLGIQVVHIEGGDVTTGGAFDDVYRDVMTRFASIHWPTSSHAKSRLADLGVLDTDICTIGLPSLDEIKSGNLLNARDLSLELGINIGPSAELILFTFHSVSSVWSEASSTVAQCLVALKNWVSMSENRFVLVSYPNNDPGGVGIINEIEKFSSGCDRVILRETFGLSIVFSIYNLGASGVKSVCVGNSSSGIKEASVFGCPVVNIGDRQNGRFRTSNIIDVSCDVASISDGLSKAFSAAFIRKCKGMHSPYWQGGAGERALHDLEARRSANDGNTK